MTFKDPFAPWYNGRNATPRMHYHMIEIVYRERAERFAALARRYTRRGRWMSHVRLVVFLLAAALVVAAWQNAHAWLGFLAGGVAFTGFCAAVAYHEHVEHQVRRSRLMHEINEQAIARLHRDWASLPESPVAVPPQHAAAANDLDLVGHASLLHFLSLASTPVGIEVLRDWLLEPAAPDEIQRRQQAAAELAPHLDLRQRLMLEGRLLADRGRGTSRFVQWAEDEPWFARRPWLVWPIRAAGLAILLVIVLTACRIVPVDCGALAVFAVVVFNVLVTVVFGGRVHDLFAVASLRSREPARYLRLFDLMYSMPNSASELGKIQRDATFVGGGVLRRMGQLHRVAVLARISHSAFLFLFVYLPLQLLFLYDFHVLGLLEAWQTRYGRYVRGWFLALGKFEALASLGGLVHDQPDWAMPTVDASATAFRARSLAHPLLPDATRVANDVEVGPPGSFLLVTGSNMSGKSTLLRAIGVNAALAQAGGPVCAQQLVMPPAVLATSIRIRDSLEDGVSFYMAELMRLKAIVDLAREPGSRNGRLLLYLLDEILLGTNSKERHIAVVRVLEHLTGQQAIGAISTHDLDLAAHGSLAAVCRCVHFCETLHDDRAERRMTFDYRLRPGVATTTNALKLLAMVGLGDVV
jgi:hypothetical protein